MSFSSTQSDSAVLRELGRRLARQRLNLNLTQQALAHEAGISLRTLNRIECGEPSQTSNIMRILRALGLLDNLDALVPDTPASPIQQLKLKGKVRKRASSAPARRVEEPWSWSTPEAQAAQGSVDSAEAGAAQGTRDRPAAEAAQGTRVRSETEVARPADDDAQERP